MNKLLPIQFLLVLLIGMAVRSNAQSGPSSCTVENLIYTLNDDGQTVTLYGHQNGINASGQLHIVDSVWLDDGYRHVVAIRNSAFAGCNGLSGNVTLPQTLVTIGTYAFYGCSGLSGTLTIPNSVTTIGNYAFFHCIGFTGLNLGASVTTLGDFAFYSCNALAGSLVIPDAVTAIGEGAFRYCNNLNGSLALGSALGTIGNDAFHNCNFVSIVSRATTPPVLGNNAFAGLGATIPVNVPCGSGTAYSSINWGGFSNITEDCNNDNVVHAQYYPDPDDSDSPYVTVYWSEELADDFETGGFSSQPWANDPLHPWVICDTVSHSGTYCMRSGIQGIDDSSSSIEVTLDIPHDGMMSFFARISCEASWDKGYFYIDGTQKASWTGEGSWTQYQYPVTAGLHTFRWKYEKDESTAGGDDRLYVDDIVFYRIAPPTVPFDPSAATSTELFDIYRAKTDGTGLTLIAEDYNSRYYLDSAWATLAAADYKYGVAYANESLMVWSNSLTKPAPASITQTAALSNGWSWWSTYIEQEGINGLEMLENSMGNACTRIQSRTEFVDNLEYMGYHFWDGTLSAITNEQSYRIRTTSPCEAVITGQPALPENHPITVNPGWNWIGFPSAQPLSLTSALSAFAPEVNDQIKGRYNFATYLGNYGGVDYWDGMLTTLEPGQGYMYRSYATTAKTLVYQTGSKGETQVNGSTEGNVYQPASGAYADNMTVTAEIELNGSALRSDYELAAFVGEECRGSVKLKYVEPLDRYLAFLMVFGDGGEELSFVLTGGSETYWSSDRVVFSANAILGSPTEPYVVRFGSTSVSDKLTQSLRVYPNPVERGERFSIGMNDSEERPVRVEIVNALGALVKAETLNQWHL